MIYLLLFPLVSVLLINELEESLRRNDEAMSSNCAVPVALLPHDLVEHDILSLLPVKSLLRFKSVCKSWHSFINSDYFINDIHLKNSKAKPPFFVTGGAPSMKISRPGWHPCSSYSRCHDNRKDIDVVLWEQKCHEQLFPDLPDGILNFFWLRSSCNGLFLFSRNFSRDGIYVVNPATKQKILLPSFSDKALYMYSIKILFEASSSAYKVLMTHNTEDEDADEVEPVEHPRTRVLIFTIGTGTSWRKITCPIITTNFMAKPVKEEEVVNGAIHFNHDNFWDVHSGKSQEYIKCILAFNIKEERFHVIEHPDCCSLDIKTGRNCNKIVVDDLGHHCICVCGIQGFLHVFHADVHRTTMDVWVLEDYTNGLWFKRSSCNLLFLHKKVGFAFEKPDDAFPMDVIGVIHNQLMLKFSSYFNFLDYTIQWYDPKLGRLLDIDTSSETHVYQWYFHYIAYTYVESLVRVP